jgi:hypothetical protein
MLKNFVIWIPEFLKEIHVPYRKFLLFTIKVLTYLGLLSDGTVAALPISENTWYGEKREVA